MLAARKPPALDLRLYNSKIYNYMAIARRTDFILNHSSGYVQLRIMEALEDEDNEMAL